MSIRLVCLILAMVLGGPTLSAAGPDATYVLGGTGWALERFGRDVAILRASIGDIKNNISGSLILSCEGGDRRLTLILPKALRSPGSGFAAAGSILIRPLGSRVKAAPAVVARTTGTRDDAILIVEDGASRRHPVLAITRLLLSRPSGLDLLFHAGAGPVALNGLTPLRLAISSRGEDDIAFRDFATTCAHEARQP